MTQFFFLQYAKFNKNILTNISYLIIQKYFVLTKITLAKTQQRHLLNLAAGDP